MAALSSGTYLLEDGVAERFTCGPDGDGWAYDAVRTDPATGALVGRLELRVGAGDGAVRLHVEAGGWVLRGGMVGPDVLWRRGEQEGEAVAEGFTGTSPAYAVATARRLALEVGQVRRVRVLEVTEPVLATRLVDRAWRRTAPDRLEETDLATGQVRAYRLEDDVVVAGTGLALTRP